MKKSEEDISAIRKRFLESVREIYDDREAGVILDWLFEEISGVKKSTFVTDPELFLSLHMIGKLEEAVRRLKDHTPIQYITGISYFCGLKFRVNETVLIPRPETEELVSLVVNENNHRSGLRILDIGTGSGCIAVTLASKLDHPENTGIDIGNAALEVARQNAFLNNVKADFKLIDILDERSWRSLDMFDLIVSNPPYVRESEKALMKRNVLDHEPFQALFVPDKDPLLFYRAISLFAAEHLLPGGIIYLEINENFAKEVIGLFIVAGFENTKIYHDLRGKERMVKASKVSE